MTRRLSQSNIMTSMRFRVAPAALLVISSLGILNDVVFVEAWSRSPLRHRTSTLPTTKTSSQQHSTYQTNAQTSKDSIAFLADSEGKSKNKWFPIKPADALSPHNDYDTLVKAAYLRHVLVSSEEMVDLIMDIYSKGGILPGKDVSYSQTDGDIFSRLANDVSLCTNSRDEGGKIGWVDNPNYNGNTESENFEKINQVVHDMISPDVLRNVFQERVKGGDIVKLPTTDGTGWHLIRVDDLHIVLQSSNAVAEGSKNIINKQRSKLKGSGNVPLSPVFQKVEVVNRSNHNNIIENDGNSQSNLIYSVPNAQYYKILTAGCQMNVADSERIMGVLEGELGLKPLEGANDEDGYGGTTADPSLVAPPQKSNKKKSTATTPDIILLNTCTIRDHAEQKVYDALGPYASLKRAGKSLAIVVAGCVAQQEGEALLRRFPEIDLVLGPQYIPWLGELLVEVGKGSQLCMTESMIWSERGGVGTSGSVDSTREKDGDWMVPIKRGHSTRAWVNVIYGCNEHCTYCVVPSVRGVEQSRSMEAILQECLSLAESGYKEITLLGQNIDAYGRDMMPRRTFADLLHYLNENLPSSLSRIRYVTSHPRYFSDRVIDAVANLDKVCECFHMPFQAGDDKVLRDMRRGYSYDSYMNIIRKIRNKAPDASICGDVIVGFPGESEEEFQRTLDLMEEVKFDNLNMFAYSPRPNTEAANWDNQIPQDVQSERLQRVQSLAAKHALERSQRYVGRVVEVLVEDRNPKNGNEVMGRTRQGRQVFFPGDINQLKGEMAMVEILEARTWSLVGRIAHNDLDP
jgi:tRNA-2-methylthio-N6-dimethylallyladenosine synthase